LEPFPPSPERGDPLTLPILSSPPLFLRRTNRELVSLRSTSPPRSNAVRPSSMVSFLYLFRPLNPPATRASSCRSRHSRRIPSFVGLFSLLRIYWTPCPFPVPDSFSLVLQFSFFPVFLSFFNPTHQRANCGVSKRTFLEAPFLLSPAYPPEAPPLFFYFSSVVGVGIISPPRSRFV